MLIQLTQTEEKLAFLISNMRKYILILLSIFSFTACAQDDFLSDIHGSVFPEESVFLQKLLAYTQDSNRSKLYDILASEYKSILSKNDFIRGIDSEWKLVSFDILNVEKYGVYTEVIVLVKDTSSDGILGVNHKVIFLKSEGSRKTLASFPFSKAGPISQLFWAPSWAILN